MSEPFLFSPGAGVIFDMDGLMLDTERIARIAWQQATREAGYEMSDALFASLIGRRDRDSTALLHAAFGTDFDYEATHRACNVLYNDYINRNGLPLKPGIHQLLDSFTTRRIPLAVATSTGNPTARLRLEQTGLLRYFSVVVAGNEIAHGKPAPDIYLEAIRRLGIDASASFALEDSPAGVQSAHAAGLRVIMVPDLLPPTPEIEALTWQVAESLHEVRKLFRGVENE
jgi:HAD superfamily hydrolase (TIGR01509 family)